MSTVTSILAADIVSASRTTINTNFGNLNTDKLEAPVNASLIGAQTVSNTEFGYLDGVTGPIQSQLDGKYSSVVGVTPTVLGYLAGITSSVVSINNVQTLAGKTLITPSVASFAQAQHTHQDGAGGGQLNGSSVFSMTGGQLKTSVLGTGTANATTFLRGDNTWATPAGGAATDISCRLFQSSVTAISSAWVPVAFTQESFDTDTMHTNAAATRITFTTAGKYSIGGVVGTSPNTIVGARIKLNGAASSILTAQVQGNSAAGERANVATIASVQAADYVELEGYTSAAQNTTGDAETNFWAHKIG